MFLVHGDSQVQILDADAEAINMESTATTPDDLQDGTSKHRGLSFKNSGRLFSRVWHIRRWWKNGILWDKLELIPNRKLAKDAGKTYE